MNIVIKRKALQALKKKTQGNIETYYWGSARRIGREIHIEWINILEDHNYEKRGATVAKPTIEWYNNMLNLVTEMRPEFIFIGHTHPGTCYHAGRFSDGDAIADKFDNKVFKEYGIKFISMLYSHDLDKLQARWINRNRFEYYNIYSE
jgi:hypothetical protein